MKPSTFEDLGLMVVPLPTLLKNRLTNFCSQDLPQTSPLPILQMPKGARSLLTMGDHQPSLAKNSQKLQIVFKRMLRKTLASIKAL